MSDTNDTQHQQDPAEGADPDNEQPGAINGSHHAQDPAEGADSDDDQPPANAQTSAAAQQQNEKRELNDGDDATRPGGDEPPD